MYGTEPSTDHVTPSLVEWQAVKPGLLLRKHPRCILSQKRQRTAEAIVWCALDGHQETTVRQLRPVPAAEGRVRVARRVALLAHVAVTPAQSSVI